MQLNCVMISMNEGKKRKEEGNFLFLTRNHDIHFFEITRSIFHFYDRIQAVC
jgi:hypothetical protein